MNEDMFLQSYCGFAFDAGLQIAELERKLAAVTCAHNWERVYGSGSDGTEYWTGTKKCTRCGALR